MHADHVAIDLTYGTAQYAKSAPSWVDENTGEVRTTSPGAGDEAEEAGANGAAHAQLESHTGVEGELSESDLEAITEVEEPSYA